MYGKERYRIEPFRHRVDLEPDYKEKTWKVLENAIHEIFNHNPSKLSFEELYRSAYNMVLHKFGHHLYDNLVSTVSAHVEEVGKHVERKDGEAFLQELVLAWSQYTRAMQNIRDILMYMNKTYVKQYNKTPVHELGLKIWNEHLLQRSLIKTMLQNAVLETLNKHRNGETTVHKLVPQVTKMVMSIGLHVYEELIERPVESETETFYKLESQKAISEYDCSSFLKLVDRRLAEETDMILKYLFETSKGKIIRKVERELIEKQFDTLIRMEASGLLHQLNSHQYDNLQLMYKLFQRCQGGHGAMIKVLKEHMVQLGEKIINQHISSSGEIVQLVQGLIDERCLYNNIIKRSFASNKVFVQAAQSSFEKIMNTNPATPEYLSLFLDYHLRKEMKGKTDEEVDSLIDKVMTLFRYLHEKDIFEKYYKQHLAKRLLSGKLSLEEHERSLILKLKTECGYQFTSKLESMFNDIRVSQDTMHNFNTMLEHKKENLKGMELNVQILTTGSWPTQPALQYQIPKQLQHCCALFEEFYLKTHSGRKLTWQTNMGYGEVRAVFGAQKHELCVSTMQMCVLLLFTDVDRFSYKDISDATGMPEPDLKRTLQSLACVKGKNVLSKLPPGREIGDDDEFVYNVNYKSKLFRVKIGTISSQKDNEGEKQEVKLRIEEDRKPQIEAAIVRIMKSRRVLNHNAVVSEVTQMLSPRFMPSPAMIKQRIESLIEREFLERDDADRKCYKYIA